MEQDKPEPALFKESTIMSECAHFWVSDLQLNNTK